MFTLAQTQLDSPFVGFYTVTYRLGYREKFDVKV